MECAECKSETNRNSTFTCASEECSSKSATLCKFCIATHSRRGHSIHDCNKSVVKLCEEHKVVPVFLCKTCEIYFCFECVGTHASHDFSSLESESMAAKKMAFSLIEKLDSMDKLARSKCQIREDMIRAKKDSLKLANPETLFDAMFDGVKEFFLKKLQEFMSQNLDQKDDGNRMKNIVDESDLLNVDLREYLQLSDIQQCEKLKLLTEKVEENTKKFAEENDKWASFSQIFYPKLIDDEDFKKRICTSIDGIKLPQINERPCKTPFETKGADL